MPIHKTGKSVKCSKKIKPLFLKSMLKNYKDWYGLFSNGELINVKSFPYEPSIWDFRSYYNSDNNYEVRLLNITF